MGGLATIETVDGVRAAWAEVNGFTLAELSFPPGYRQEWSVPAAPYLAFVLEGSLEKSFGGRTMGLERGQAVTMPVGAAHSARFGAGGARIAIVKLREPVAGTAGCLDRLRAVRATRLAWLASRLTAELYAADTAAPLAAEGYALELLAAAARDGDSDSRPAAWLREAEDLLRSRGGECIRLGDLAEAVGVSPARLARAFRLRHGVSVGEYGRRLRLEAAATALADTDAPLAAIAADAGFADQSHFTRLFMRHVGVTPGRYRLELRDPRVPTA